MNDSILEACYDGLKSAGYDTAELDPGGIYVEVGGKPYSVVAFEIEPEQEVQRTRIVDERYGRFEEKEELT